MTRKIVIDVKGKPGSGKSAVIDVIAEALRSHEFDVTIFSIDNIQRTPEQSKKAVENVSKSTSIEIVEMQAPRADKIYGY